MKSIACANPLGGHGLMTGTATDLFGSLLDTSRAMIVTIIHRLEQTLSGSENIFTDVDLGTWYTDVVAWAAANGIVEGYGGRAVGSGLISGKGNGILDPTGPAKKAETLAILQRFIESNVK